MNDIDESKIQPSSSLLLLTELEGGHPISQREMAKRLGVALGLVNTYIKTLVHKGFLQIIAYPRNRYAYLLTPAGIAEKSRIAYQQTAYFHFLFRTARQDSLNIFSRIRSQNIADVVFCGVDEFTEIAYLSLSEAGLNLVGVYDNDQPGVVFFGTTILPLNGVPRDGTPIVITSLRHAEILHDQLISSGISDSFIYGPLFTCMAKRRTNL